MEEIVSLVSAMRKELMHLRRMVVHTDEIMREIGAFPLVGGKHGGGGTHRFRAEVSIAKVKEYWMLQSMASSLCEKTGSQVDLLSDEPENRTAPERPSASGKPKEAARWSSDQKHRGRKKPAKPKAPAP